MPDSKIADVEGDDAGPGRDPVSPAQEQIGNEKSADTTATTPPSNVVDRGVPITEFYGPGDRTRREYGS